MSLDSLQFVFVPNVLFVCLFVWIVWFFFFSFDDDFSVDERILLWEIKLSAHCHSNWLNSLGTFVQTLNWNRRSTCCHHSLNVLLQKKEMVGFLVFLRRSLQATRLQALWCKFYYIKISVVIRWQRQWQRLLYRKLWNGKWNSKKRAP